MQKQNNYPTGVHSRLLMNVGICVLHWWCCIPDDCKIFQLNRK